MTTAFILLQAQSGANGGGVSMIIMMVVLFALMYFFMIRPQSKKQKEIQRFRNALQVGQEVLTASGVHGKIKAINETENTISLEIARDTVIIIEVNSIMPKGNEAAPKK